MKTSVLVPRTIPTVLRVGETDADLKGFTSLVIQCALDAVFARGGGTVLLSKGEYEIKRPLLLHSGISLIGEGEDTVLKKTPGVAARMVEDVGTREFKVRVDNATGFHPGSGLLIHDESVMYGNLTTTAVVTAVEGDTIYFAPWSRYDYESDREGLVSTSSSVIEIVDASDVTVQKLRIDGNGGTNSWINGNVGGGIFMRAVSGVVVDNVIVEHVNGDGISWQVTEDVTIRNCRIQHCHHFGLHPGTGTERTLVEDCCVTDNKRIGLFVCYRVKHGVFRRNDFSRNGKQGMSIGHKDTDNLFLENRFCDNGETGICVRSEKDSNGAHRNRYERNVIENNGGPEKGFGVYMQGVARDNQFIDNTIRDTGTGRQKTGVWQEKGKTGGTILEGNVMTGHAIADLAE